MTTHDHILPPPLRDDGPLETMARAIIEAQGYSPSENELARARDEVPGIITALTEAGYAIVPVDPTEAMLDAYWDTIEGHPDRAEGTEPYPLGITVYHALVNAGKVEG